jgi:hypothetical protein
MVADQYGGTTTTAVLADFSRRVGDRCGLRD